MIIIIGLVVFLTLFSAFFVLITKNLFHACFGLFFSLFGIAVIYVLCGADFLAGSQIMVYIGGILILILFGLMLTKVSKNMIFVENEANVLYYIFPAGLSVLLIFANLNILENRMSPIKIQGSQIQNIGFEILTGSLLPFEIIGIILLVALIGASFIAKITKS